MLPVTWPSFLSSLKANDVIAEFHIIVVSRPLTHLLALALTFHQLCDLLQDPAIMGRKLSVSVSACVSVYLH